jgi:hypothetical protein
MQIYPEVHVCADLDRIAALTDQRDALQKALAAAEGERVWCGKCALLLPLSSCGDIVEWKGEYGYPVYLCPHCGGEVQSMQALATHVARTETALAAAEARAERLAAAVRCAREMRDDSITFNSATYWYEQETVLLAALQPGDLGDGQEDAG